MNRGPGPLLLVPNSGPGGQVHSPAAPEPLPPQWRPQDPGWGTTAQRKIVSSNKSALTTVRIKGKDEMRRQSSDQMGRQ